MEIGKFAPHIARAIITHLDECGVENINVFFSTKNNTCEEVLQRADVNNTIVLNVAKRAVNNLMFGPMGISMTIAFDGVPRDVVFMPEDLLGVFIPIPGTSNTWCYMLRDIDDQLRLLATAAGSQAVSQ